MSANNDSIQKTVTVTVLLCLVCAILVASAAVFLKPLQVKNKLESQQRSVLEIAGIYDANKSISEQFAAITPKLVDLRTGLFTDEVDAASYDQRKAAKNPEFSALLSGDIDEASIKRRAHLAKIYVIEKEGQIDTLILPVHGYGLWSTMYGYLALQGDTRTVVGFGFYDQGETPGLGAEIDNPKWKGLWVGKEVVDTDFNTALSIVKGGANPKGKNFKHEVDAIAGATLTTNGVQNLMNFWLGDNGFGPFLVKLRAGEA